MQSSSEIKPHLFPFLQPGSEEELTLLYKDVSQTMLAIDNGNKKMEDLLEIAQKWWVWFSFFHCA